MAAGSSKIGSFVWLVRLRHAQGLRYPTDVLLGTLILWVVLRSLGDSNPVWWDIPSGAALCGSLVALIIAWIIVRFWPVPADLRKA